MMPTPKFTPAARMCVRTSSTTSRTDGPRGARSARHPCARCDRRGLLDRFERRDADMILSAGLADLALLVRPRRCARQRPTPLGISVHACVIRRSFSLDDSGSPHTAARTAQAPTPGAPDLASSSRGELPRPGHTGGQQHVRGAQGREQRGNALEVAGEQQLPDDVHACLEVCVVDDQRVMRGERLGPAPEPDAHPRDDAEVRLHEQRLQRRPEARL